MKATKTSVRPDLDPLPATMRGLAVDERGYPVPWFVAWQDGKPEFRMMDPDKMVMAVRHRRCWVCGGPMGRRMTFVAGPMCGINRTSAEPPSHHECAVWSARNCPFLSNASRPRREDDLINNQELARHSAGVAITRNPGVTLLWSTRSYVVFKPPGGGVLFELGDPDGVEFYANGRPATRADIDRSIETGLPALHEMAHAEGPHAVQELERMTARLVALLPAPDVVEPST